SSPGGGGGPAAGWWRGNLHLQHGSLKLPLHRASAVPLPLRGRIVYWHAMTADPFALFDAWYAEARVSEPNDSNAMALGTVGADGQPSVRMVLLKGHGPDGFVFYTNEESRKA